MYVYYREQYDLGERGWHIAMPVFFFLRTMPCCPLAVKPFEKKQHPYVNHDNTTHPFYTPPQLANAHGAVSRLDKTFKKTKKKVVTEKH